MSAADHIMFGPPGGGASPSHSGGDRSGQAVDVLFCVAIRTMTKPEIKDYKYSRARKQEAGGGGSEV
jgi:hypothetical protein